MPSVTCARSFSPQCYPMRRMAEQRKTFVEVPLVEIKLEENLRVNFCKSERRWEIIKMLEMYLKEIRKI